MKFIKIVSLVATLLAAAAAHAVPITWDIEGHLTEASDATPLGLPLEVLLSFDSNAAFLNQSTPGRYAYSPAATTMAIWLDGSYIKTFHYNPGFGGALFVRDDSLVGGVPMDGYTFGLNEDNGSGGILTLQFIMRGTNTDLLSGGALPTVPPAGLLAEESHVFQVCESSPNSPNSCDLTFYEFELDAVRAVSEPGTLALLGLGALGLAALRQRRRRQ